MISGAGCLRCRTAYPQAGLPDRCPACGGFWGYPRGLRWSPPAPREEASGLRRWAAALGLGAGELPDREPGGEPVVLDGVTAVQEGSRPRGTFKERGAEALAAVAARRGLSEVFLDSSGNAGLAVAGASAARGIACRVLLPASTPAEKLRRIEAAGGTLEVVPGDRRAAADAAERLRGRLPYASHVYQPFFLAGVATLAWELEEALGGRSRSEREIERMVVPSGNGSLLLGLALGFDALLAAGRLRAVPALHAVQLAGYAALSPEGPGEPAAGPPAAAGIAVAEPPRREELLRRIAQTGGDVTVVTEAEIAAARRDLAERHGLTTDPTGAAAWAGLARRPDLRREGTVAVLTSREPGIS